MLNFAMQPAQFGGNFCSRNRRCLPFDFIIENISQPQGFWLFMFVHLYTVISLTADHDEHLASHVGVLGAVGFAGVVEHIA